MNARQLEQRITRLEGNTGAVDPEAAAILADAETSAEYVSAREQHKDGLASAVAKDGTDPLTEAEKQAIDAALDSFWTAALRLADERGVHFTRLHDEQYRQQRG